MKAIQVLAKQCIAITGHASHKDIKIPITLITHMKAAINSITYYHYRAANPYLIWISCFIVLQNEYLRNNN